MMENMEKCGCPVDSKDFFVVRHCDENVGGGFDAEASKQGGIVLCQNHIRDYSHAGESRQKKNPAPCFASCSTPCGWAAAIR